VSKSVFFPHSPAPPPTSPTYSTTLMHRSTLDALSTPLNRSPNATRHEGESARCLLPAACPASCLLCVFFAEHVCVGFTCLCSPLHGVPPLHHQLVLLFLAGIRGLSFAHMSVLQQMRDPRRACVRAFLATTITAFGCVVRVLFCVRVSTLTRSSSFHPDDDALDAPPR
jgi:hypothetical protein